jgi:GT2 family glycosyltransferase
MNSPSIPQVTVAVITRNRDQSLEKTLKAISLQNYPNFEVIVVDNASTDTSKKVIERFGFKYLFSPKSYGFAKTRQLAVNEAIGEFLLWCDDDAIPVSGWIKAYIDRFLTDESIGLIAGKIVNDGFPSEMKFKGLQVFTNNGMLDRVSDPEKAFVFSNLNMGLRMSILRDIGGYDSFFSGGYEEVDLNLCIRAQGAKIVYEKTAKVDHYFSNVSFKKGRFFFGSQLMRLYLYYKHKPILKNENFFCHEFRLMYNDVYRSIRILMVGIVRFSFNIFSLGLIEFFNAISARIGIPWIIYKVNRLK